MRKEFTKVTREVLNENMEPTGEIETVMFLSLIADDGKKIREKATGLLCTRVDLGADRNETEFEEVEVND